MVQFNFNCPSAGDRSIVKLDHRSLRFVVRNMLPSQNPELVSVSTLLRIISKHTKRSAHITHYGVIL